MLEIFDTEGNNGFKYLKRGKEYRCQECPMSDFINDQRFHRHVQKFHHREINLGKNNKWRQPHISRMIPENEWLGSKKCEICGKQYRKKQDLVNHQKDKESKCYINPLDLSSPSASKHLLNCQCSGKDQRETAALEASKNLPPSATYSQFGAEESNDSEDSLDSDVCEWLDSLVIREGSVIKLCLSTYGL